MAYVVTPSIYYVADGEEFVSYDNAQVQNSDYTEYLGSQGSELGDYVFDNETQSYRHRYADIDGEELESRLDADYEEELEATDDDYLQGYYSLVGGSENYSSLIDWAAQNLNQEQIEDYDSIMDTNDPDQIEQAIEWLWAQFEEQGFEEEEQYEQDPELAEVLQLGNDPNYQNMVQWAYNNLDADLIDEYDQAMESGDASTIRQYIDGLWQLYASA